MDEAQHNLLKELALQEGISASQLLRRYIDKGLEVNGYANEINFIREQIREEMQTILKPRLERLAKLVFQSSLYSLTASNLGAHAIQSLTPPSKLKAFDEAMEESTKAALATLKNNGIRVDRGYMDGLWLFEQEDRS